MHLLQQPGVGGGGALNQPPALAAPLPICTRVLSISPHQLHKVQPHSGAGSPACCLPGHAAAGFSYDASSRPRMVLAAPTSTAEGIQQGRQQQQQHSLAPLPQQQQQQQQQQWPQQHVPRQQAGCEQPAAAHTQHKPKHTQAVQRPSNSNGASVTSERHSSSSSSSSVRTSRQGTGGRAALECFISSCIKQCSTPQQVDAVVCEYGPAFNIIHVSAAITHLAQLSQRTGQQQQQQAQPSTQLGLHHGGIAAAAAAGGGGGGHDNVQQVPGLGFITSQMAQQHAQLQQHLGQSNTAHHNPPHSWQGEQQQQQQQQQQALVLRLLQQAMPQLQHAGSRQVANILWALSVLQVPGVSSSGSSSVEDHGSGGGQPASGVCMQRLMERAAQLFGSAEAQHLSNMALAAAKLQLPVSQEWLRQLTAAWLVLVRQQQGGISSSSGRGGGSSAAERNDAGVVVSSSDRQQGLSSAGGASAAEQAASRAAAAAGAVPHTWGSAVISPQATCNLFWALVQLRHQPQQAWLQEVLAAAAHQLPSWPARNVAMLMWGCARLGYRCAGSSSDDRQQQQQQGPALSGQEQQQQQPQDVAMLDALHWCAQGFSSRDLSQALWAAAVMGLRVPDSCVALLLSAGQHTQQLSVPMKQQQILQPRGEVGHSVSVLLWSLGQLRQGARCQLPPGLLQQWVVALGQHAAAAPGQSLGVAAWAAGQLGLTATCPQLVLRLVQAAARRQHTAAQQQQQQQQAPGGAGSSSSTPGTDTQFIPELDVAAAAAVLWSAARCVVHAQQQQQQQPSRQRPEPPGHALGAWGSTGRLPPAAAAAAGSSQPAAAPGQLQQPAASSSHSNLQWAIKAAATTVAMQLVQGQAGQQLSVWRLALVLWSSSVMQLPLPAPWWHQHLQQLQALLQVQVRQQQMQMQQTQAQAQTQQVQMQQPSQQQLQQQEQQQVQQQQQCREHAQALAVSVWALGRARIRVPTPAVLQLQDASLAYLQGRGFSQEGMVLLLLGFTRLATTAAAQFPRNTRLQRDGQQKRHRLLRTRLHMRRRPGRRHTHQQQQLQQQQPGARALSQLQQQRWDQQCHWPVQRTASPQQEQQLQQQHQQHKRQQQKKQQQQQQQRRLSGRQAARRSAWWRQHLRQQRGRAVFGALLCQRQRHGWVAAAGLRAAWLQAYCAACCPCVLGLGRDGLVGVLWALGRLRFHPGRSFMAAAQQRAGQLLPGMGPRHMALLLWALARLNAPPEPQLSAALTAGWEARLASAGQADMQQVGWAQRQLQLLQEHQQLLQQQQQGVCV